jgi:hypothetical protein
LFEEFVYSGGGDSALAHCEDYGCRAEYDVAAGIDAFHRSPAVFIDDDVAPFIEFEAGGGLPDEGISDISDCDNHGIDIDSEFGAFDWDGASSA